MKKKTKGILIGLLAVGVIGSFLPEDETVKGEINEVAIEEKVCEENVCEETEKVEVTPTENEKETEKTPEPTKEEKENIRKTMIRTIASEWDKALAGQFSYSSVEYNEEIDTVVISATNDGLAQDFTAVKLGAGDTSSWDFLKESIDTMSETLKKQMEDELEITDCDVAVYVLNDINKENILYLSTNGFGLYDAMEE